MKPTAECIPCYLKNSLSTLRLIGVAESEQYRILTELFPLITQLNSKNDPATNVSLMLFELSRRFDVEDPYREAKAASNRIAKSLLPGLRETIASSEDPLLTALKISVAGNVIDMGIMPDYDVVASLREELDRDFAIFDGTDFYRLLRHTQTIVVIGDNSGEICFDFLLLEQLRRFTQDIYYIVKGGPCLNDATVADAEEAGIPMLAQVVTTGSSYLGLVPELCGESLRALIASAGLVLAKGQANYETLEGTPLAGQQTFFMLRAKCPVISAALGVKLGASVLVHN